MKDQEKKKAVFIVYPNSLESQQPNQITFLVNEKEMLRLDGDGNIYVNGRLAENDKEVVQAMRSFLEHVQKH